MPRADIVADALEEGTGRTLCPYKGIAHYFDVTVGDDQLPAVAWSYPEALPESARLAGYVSFDVDRVEVWLEGERLLAADHQSVITIGSDRDLTATAA